MDKIKLKLGLAEYELEFDAAALMAFEKVSGRSILTDVLEKPRFSDMVHLLWAGLRRQDPQITVAQVQELFVVARLNEISTVVMTAVVRAIGGEKPAAETPGPLVPSASPGPK